MEYPKPPSRPKQQQPQQQQHDPPPAPAQAEDPTSRLCVKNIPKYLPEQRLKDHFAAKGQVTDVKILKTRDGQPRQMAFVGYRTVEDAAAAMKYFNNTFIDTCRIVIEYARRYKQYDPAAAAAAAAAAAGPDPQAAAHRPWSKYSAGSSKHQQLLAKQAPAAGAAEGDAAAAKKAKKEKRKGGRAADAVDDAAAADPKLAEFLELMQPRAKAKIWSNDEVLPGQAGKAAAKAAAAAAVTAAAAAAKSGAEEEPDDLYEDLPAAAATASRRRLNGLGAAAASADSEGTSSDSDSDSEDDSDPLAAKDAVVLDEGVSDLDYLRARMRKGPAAAAAAAAAGAGGSEDGDDSSSSSSSDESDDAFDDDHEAQRQRQHLASTSSGGSEDGSEDGSDSDAGGSDGDVMHWQQQQQGRLPRGSKKQGVGEQGSDEQQPSGSGSEGGSSSEESEGDDEQQQQQHAGGDAMDVDGQAHQPFPAAAGGSEEAAAAEEAIRESGRLFVRNLAYTAGQLELSELFGAHGDLEEVHLVLDRETRQSKGIAYVKYLLPEDAVAAYRALDMTPFQGRLLHVLPAKRKPGEDVEEKPDKQGAAGYKADRDAARKRDAGNRSAWSTLFMRPDTVAAAVAAHYGVSKAQLLDAGAEDLPLRMALGEAQVIAQTKAALADLGINTKALEAAAAASGSAAATKSVSRSASTLLVKNLPYGADSDELQQLFIGPGRSVLRLVLPPTKTLAVVEFGEPQDARAAFKALAYKKYQQVPLYLEWAPKDIWDTPPPAAPLTSKPAPAAAAAAAASDTAGEAARGQQPAKGAAAAAAAAAAAGDEEEDGEAEPTVSIYVKNLNFSTSDKSLKHHFDKAVSAAGGQIHSAKVARRKGPDGKLLSMGYGFVETDSEEAAKAAIKQLQGTMLDKHKLTLQLSKRSATGSGGNSSSSKAGKRSKEGDGGKGAKLVVRNVAFEATRKDIMGLFGPFGHIKSCRLPKKFDGNHRGFAFLEFTTKQEAANALEGVGGTHLYGRRLVVEYAQADAEGGLSATGEASDLVQARAKTAAKFFGSDGRAGDGEDAAAADAPARKRMKRNL